MFDDKYTFLNFNKFTKNLNLDVIIETGTKWGDSTIKFVKYADVVHSVELIPNFRQKACINYYNTFTDRKFELEKQLISQKFYPKEIINLINQQNILRPYNHTEELFSPHITDKNKYIQLDSCYFWLGDVKEKLSEILEHSTTQKKNILFYLDAHNHQKNVINNSLDNPLLNELKIIADKIIEKNTLYIIIDDFANPNNLDIKHNTYKDENGNNISLNITYIKDSLDLIYGKNNYNVSYTEKTETKNTSGKIFIKPKRIEEI